MTRASDLNWVHIDYGKHPYDLRVLIDGNEVYVKSVAVRHTMDDIAEITLVIPTNNFTTGVKDGT